MVNFRNSFYTILNRFAMPSSTQFTCNVNDRTSSNFASIGNIGIYDCQKWKV